MRIKLLTVVYKSLNYLGLVSLCNLIYYQIPSRSFFPAFSIFSIHFFSIFFRFCKHPRGFWSHANAPRLSHRVLSSTFLHHLSFCRWLNPPLFLWASVCWRCTPASTTQLLIDHIFPFWKVSSGTIYLHSCPNSESPGPLRHLPCPATHEWFYSDWKANQM